MHCVCVFEWRAFFFQGSDAASVISVRSQEEAGYSAQEHPSGCNRAIEQTDKQVGLSKDL